MSRTLLALTALVVLCTVLVFPGTAYTPGRLTIVNTAFTVKAGAARYFEFSVGNDGGKITGRFRAEGGGGNDIQCVILDGDQFENWQNGHTVPTYYNSGKITVANINVSLGEGNYVLVFSNKYSVMTAKAVTANVELQW